MSRILFLCLALLGLSAGKQGFAAPDLKWDLSYASALNSHPIGANEFMQFWPARYPARPIHDKLAAYAGEPIEASLLIEKPDGHTGDPSATWFIKTRTEASACSFHPKHMKDPCKSLDPARTEAFIREVMNFKPLDNVSSTASEIGKAPDGTPILLNYLGFVSVYVNGKSLQRPIAVTELSDSTASVPGVAPPDAGRLSRALAKVLLTDADYLKREAALNVQSRQHAFEDAVRRGNLDEVNRLLDRGAHMESDALHAVETPALAIAAGSGQQKMVDLLLDRGARIDATESAALKAAVGAGNAGMAEYLLAKGAKIDPPPESLNSYKKIFESPLGMAVRSGNEDIARLLMDRGADVNIAQARPMIASAAVNHDLAMVDLLLQHGAKPDRVDTSYDMTALMLLMAHAGNLSGWPQDKEKQQAILDQEAIIAKLVRRLVAGGANVNYVNRICTTAYSEAATYHSEGMKRLLVELGADPELERRCHEKQVQGERGSTDGAEATARAALAKQTNLALQNGDYKSLERLYHSLNKESERTPSGIWKLAVFYAQLKRYPSWKRDPAHWTALEDRARAWERQFPKSVPAQIFHAYIHWNRALAYRGDKAYADVSPEDRKEVAFAGTAAFNQLQMVKHLATNDPEWHRALAVVLPYIGRTAMDVASAAREGMAQHPYYHELYFSAAFYMQPKWGGSNDAIDSLARDAMAATARKEKRALYARIYWYLNQTVYDGDLFKSSKASWPDMKNGFDDLLSAYPDPWNMNAYAYFACLAKDYGIMNNLLAKIGDRLVFSSWGSGGRQIYQDCVMAGEGDQSPGREGATAAASTPATAQEAALRKKQEDDYYSLIRRATSLRQEQRHGEALEALRAAEDLDRKLGRVNMMTQYHLGWTLVDLGRLDEAVRAFSRGVPTQPDYPFAYWRRGLALEALVRKEEAREDFDMTAYCLSIAEKKLDDAAFLALLRTKLRQYGLDGKYVF